MPAPRWMDASVPRICRTAPPPAPGDRDVFQILQRIHPVLRSLGRDGVAHAVLRVEPVRRRGLEAAAERNQQVVGNVALREAGQLRLGPVHIDVQMRFIEGLLDAQVGRSGNRLDSSQQLVRRIARFACRSYPTTWISIGEGKPKFKIWLTMSAGRKEKSTPGNCVRQLQAQIVDILFSRTMLRRQRDHDVGVSRTGRR